MVRLKRAIALWTAFLTDLNITGQYSTGLVVHADLYPCDSIDELNYARDFVSFFVENYLLSTLILCGGELENIITCGTQELDSYSEEETVRYKRQLFQVKPTGTQLYTNCLEGGSSDSALGRKYSLYPM